ncbi:L,D-transpeptidase [Microvirga sp. KLBC 81]|uniref:L,D-transpeptidase n=1 Tax=Microvirga sp. KLBC 81 TaxID=1862707 RepID=UPI00197C34F3|nr:L,D-transpeptidase [Microvirga sp. KLBC 81]
MIRSVFTVVAFTCSVAFMGSAEAQTVASLGREPASFFERLFGGPISPTARRLVSWSGTHRPGTIVISTSQRRLYFVLGNGQAIQYGVGVGRPGFTWAGIKTVSMKREWPDWSPPAAMLRRRPDLPRYMPGGLGNPLGARALYLGSSMYRIHGSNEPETIGYAVSSGCIRMTNADIIDLYNRTRIGTKVVVLR